MIVLDASAVIDLVLDLKGGSAVAARLAREPSRHAPHLVDLEIAQVLRRLEAADQISERRGRLALDDVGLVGLTRHAHVSLTPRIWSLRRNATAYDAAYLALAEALDAPLVTTDAKLARVVGSRAEVEVLR